MDCRPTGLQLMGSVTRQTTRMSELTGGHGADIDHQLVPRIKFLNRLGCTTINSCQGNPGDTREGGRHGFVQFIVDDTRNSDPLVAFTFNFLNHFVGHMWPAVRLSVKLSGDSGFFGEMRFNNEVIEEITKRLGVYCEMQHK